MDLNRFAEAEERFRQAIELAPETPGNWVNLGVNLFRQRKAGCRGGTYLRAQELETQSG